MSSGTVRETQRVLLAVHTTSQPSTQRLECSVPCCPDSDFIGIEDPRLLRNRDSVSRTSRETYASRFLLLVFQKKPFRQYQFLNLRVSCEMAGIFTQSPCESPQGRAGIFLNKLPVIMRVRGGNSLIVGNSSKVPRHFQEEAQEKKLVLPIQGFFC